MVHLGPLGWEVKLNESRCHKCQLLISILCQDYVVRVLNEFQKGSLDLVPNLVAAWLLGITDISTECH